MKFRIVPLFFLMIVLSGCQCSSRANAVLRISGKKSDISFDVEVVRSDADRRQGLMNRNSLSQEKGMLFMFETEERHSFWMKNTKIPLDLVFFDNNWNVVGTVEGMEPMSLTVRGIEKPSRYVLEINAGLVRKESISTDDAATFTEKK